ncbi:hypothetical protein TWF718_009841 [Orbilia javanica]|uniref:Uncharacterized protein n=1 Tax=Orbilia javanica TaxID=47235 RepID=A0AAN8MN28_9PEZI
MSGSNSAGSREAFETAVEVLSGFRDGNPASVSPSPSAHLVPRTPEEFDYVRCEKYRKKTTMTKLRTDLGIPSGNADTEMANNYKWDKLSDLVHRLVRELNYETESVANLAKLSRDIENSPEWKDCNPKRPAAAFIPVFIHRWKKNRRMTKRKIQRDAMHNSEPTD